MCIRDRCLRGPRSGADVRREVLAGEGGAGGDEVGGRIVFEGTPADLVAARATLTGEHLAAYVGT